MAEKAQMPQSTGKCHNKNVSYLSTATSTLGLHEDVCDSEVGHTASNLVDWL